MIYLHFDPSESSHLTNKCTSHITQHLTRVFTRFFHNTTEIVLYELFSSESNRDSGRMDSIKLLPLSDFKKSALLSTFDVDTKGKDGGVMFARYNYPHSMFTLWTSLGLQSLSSSVHTLIISLLYLGSITIIQFSLTFPTYHYHLVLSNYAADASPLPNHRVLHSYHTSTFQILENSNSFDNSFWNEKATDRKNDHSSANSQAGKDIVISAIFLLGEISMLGFSLEEDESVAVTQKKSSQSRLPGYTISEISKSFKIILPKKIILLTQILMSPYLPYGNERDTFSSSLSQTCGDLHLSQNSQFCDNPKSGRECSAVIRAHAFVVMGKFCLRDRNMARNHVNVFLRELHNPKNGKITKTFYLF